MNKKVALISGGTSGIGLETAKLLLRENWKVAINGRSEEKGLRALEELKEISQDVIFIKADVSKTKECKLIVTKTKEKLGAINSVITAAGYYNEILLSNLTEEEFDSMIDANLKGTVFLIKEALNELKRNKGSVVTISSDAGIQGNIACSLYGATKGAIVSFTKSLALELAIHGVRVNTVCPGDVDTPLLDEQIGDKSEKEMAIKEMATHYPLGRVATAEEIANVIVFLASDKASFVTGAAWTVDGGLTAW